MKYVSEETLKLILGYFNSLKDANNILEVMGAKAAIESLIEVECKELPDQQWQTIDEFKANPVDAWCHISCGDKKEIVMAFFEDGIFWYNDLSKGSDNFSHIEITHVMQIKTPGAPK